MKLLNIEEMIMEIIDQNFELILVPSSTFILLGVDFTNLKQICMFYNLEYNNFQASSQKFRQIISTRYGPDIIRQWKQLERQDKKKWQE